MARFDNAECCRHGSGGWDGTDTYNGRWITWPVDGKGGGVGADGRGFIVWP